MTMFTVQYYSEKYANMGALVPWFPVKPKSHYDTLDSAEKCAFAAARKYHRRTRVVNAEGEELMYYNALGEKC